MFQPSLSGLMIYFERIKTRCHPNGTKQQTKTQQSTTSPSSAGSPTTHRSSLSSGDPPAVTCGHGMAPVLPCWDGVFFTAERCCDLGLSPWGRTECWVAPYNFRRCCPPVKALRLSVQNLSNRCDCMDPMSFGILQVEAERCATGDNE